MVSPSDDQSALLKRWLLELSKNPDEDRAAFLHHQAGRVCLALSDARALAHLQKAAELNPGHRPSVRDARRALVAAKNTQLALPLFDVELRLAELPEDRVALLTEKARILEANGDLPEALSAYRTGLELVPGDLTLLKGVQRCLLRDPAGNSTGDVYVQLANAHEGHPAYRAALLVLSSQIDSTEIGVIETALSLDPGTANGLNELEYRARQAKNWTATVAALKHQRDLLPEGAVPERIAVLQDIASLEELRLGDLPSAIATLESASTLAGGQEPWRSTIARDLASLYRRTGRHDKVAAVLAAALSDSSDEQGAERAPEDSFRLGEIYRTHLNDDAAAQTWFAHALALDPSHEASATALSLLYQKNREWEPLVQLLISEAERSSKPETKGAGMARAARVYEEKLNNPEMAIQLHQKALAYTPDQEPCFVALTRLFRQEQRWTELVELHRRAIDRAETDERKVALLFRIGAVFEDELGDWPGAIHAYKQILALDLAEGNRANLGAAQALVGAAERGKDFVELLSALDGQAKLMPKGQAKEAVLFRAAEVCLDHLADPAQAVSRLSALLETNANYGAALTTLGRAFSSLGRWEDLLAVREKMVALQDEPEEKIRTFWGMAETAELQMGAPGTAAAYLRRALALAPSRSSLLERLEDLYRKAGAFAELESITKEALSGAKDPAETHDLAMRLADLYGGPLAKPARAIEATKQALAANPNSSLASRRREQLLRAEENWEQLVLALRERAASSAIPRERDNALLRAADAAANRLHDPSLAEAIYREVLASTAGHPNALLGLEAVLLQHGDAEKLAELYGQHAAHLPKEDLSAAALRELAVVELGRDNEAGARTAYQQLLEVDPKAEDALLYLAEHAESLSAQVSSYAALASTAPRSLAATYHLRIAEVVEAQDPAQALMAYRTSLALDENQLSAVYGYARVAQQASDARALEDAAIRVANLGHDKDRASELLLAAAGIYREKGELEKVGGALEKAFSIRPDSERVADAMAITLGEIGQADKLIELLTRAAEGPVPLLRRADLYFRTGEAQVELRGDVGAAIAALRRALSSMPDHVPSLSLLSSCFELTEQWKSAGDTLKLLVKHSTDATELMDAHLHLGEISNDHLKDASQARQSLEYVLNKQPTNKSALKRLGTLNAAEGNTAKAIELGQRLVKAADAPSERAEALVGLAAIEGVRGAKKEEAAALLEAVAIQGPGGGAGPRYTELVSDDDSPATLEDYLGALMQHLDLARKNRGPLGPAFISLANVFKRLNRPDRVMDTLRKATEEVPTDASLSRAYARHLISAGAADRAATEARRFLAYDVVSPELWRILADSFATGGDSSEAAAMLSTLITVGGATPQETISISARPANPAGAQPGLLGDAGFREVQIDECMDHAAVALLSALTDNARKVRPGDLGRYGVSKRDKLTPKSIDATRSLADKIGRILGVSDFDVYVHDAQASGATIELFSTPAIMVPSWAVTSGSDAELAFVLGRALSFLSRQVPCLGLADPELARELILGAARNASVTFEDPTATSEELDEFAETVNRGNSMWSRRDLDEPAEAYVNSPLADVTGWMAAFTQTCNRAALLVCDDVNAAVAVLDRGVNGPTPAAVDLLTFWASDAAHRFRRAARASV